MSWWRDVLYGPEMVERVADGTVEMRSRTLEFEEVLLVADQIDEHLANMSARQWMVMAIERPEELAAVHVHGDDGPVSRESKVDQLSRRQLASLVLTQPQIYLAVHIGIGQVPRVSLGMGQLREDQLAVARYFQQHGSPRVWWQRWPAALPWALFAAAVFAGVAALATTDLPLAWFVLLPLVAVLLVPGVRRWTTELSDRTANKAPGMRIHHQPRAELRADRANSRANMKAGAVGAAVGGIVTGLVAVWLG